MNDIQDRQLREFVERGRRAQEAVDAELEKIAPVKKDYHPTATGECLGKHCRWHAKEES